MAVLCVSCKEEEHISPYLSAAETKAAVLGTWKIAKIDYQLCRSGSCNKTDYTGSAQDYFEFRPDSAFLVYNTAANSSHKQDAFRAEYSLPGAFILTHRFWSAKYTLKECRPNKMVLTCTYAGNDPYATFTDIYYLYR